MSQQDESFEPDQYGGYSEMHTDEATALALLDHLHNLVVEARSVPMSASALLNRAQVLDLLDQIREALPRDVLTADDIVNRADAVLERANNEANSRLRDAQVRADEIVEKAQQEAQLVSANASDQSEQTIGEANTRAEQILADAQAQSERLVTSEHVLQEATARAHKITLSAESQADKLILNANEYALNKMNELMQSALDVARTAEAGISRIDKRLAQQDHSQEYEAD